MIELDVRVQAGALVLAHDPTSSEQTYCPLKQALMEVEGKVALNLELKELKTVKLLQKTLKNYDGKIIISSFKFNILHEVRRLMPEYEIAILERWSGVRGIAEASLLKTNRLNMNEKWLWSSFVQSLKSQGFTIYAYTVNDTERAEELKSWGISGIITDFPNRIKA
jgi:glycerophosphoryl diester phosphodiesterase